MGQIVRHSETYKISWADGPMYVEDRHPPGFKVVVRDVDPEWTEGQMRQWIQEEVAAKFNGSMIISLHIGVLQHQSRDNMVFITAQTSENAAIVFDVCWNWYRKVNFYCAVEFGRSKRS